MLEENGFPLAPLILALILGPLIEENFMQSIIKADGDLVQFVMRPIAGTLGALTLSVWAYLTWSSLRHRHQTAVPGLPEARDGA